MPTLPTSRKRPWLPERKKQEGRRFITKFYLSKEWRKLRATFISGVSTHLGTPEPHPNSLCIECARKGISTPTHTIDHIKPINRNDPYNTKNGMYGEPLEWTNLQPLCEPHHAKKTGRERYTNKH